MLFPATSLDSNYLDKLWARYVDSNSHSNGFTNSAFNYRSPKNEKHIDLGEISDGQIPSSTWNYPWFALFFKGFFVDVRVLGCTVGYVLFALHCHLIPYFFREISFVEWKATRPRGEGRRRWGHAWMAYFHIWGSYSAESRPQVEIKRGIYWCKWYAHFNRFPVFHWDFLILPRDLQTWNT